MKKPQKQTLEMLELLKTQKALLKSKELEIQKLLKYKTEEERKKNLIKNKELEIQEIIKIQAEERRREAEEATRLVPATCGNCEFFYRERPHRHPMLVWASSCAKNPNLQPKENTVPDRHACPIKSKARHLTDRYPDEASVMFSANIEYDARERQRERERQEADRKVWKREQEAERKKDEEYGKLHRLKLKKDLIP